MTKTRAEEYRRLAHGCLALAKSVATEEARIALIGMASRWLRLAEEQADGTDDPGVMVPPTSTETAQVPVQQQQQIQPEDDDKKE